MANMWLYVRLLCLMQRTVFSAFKMCHFELQNVCKAENVFKVLETWEEGLLSVCQFKCVWYACHFSVFATGKKLYWQCVSQHWRRSCFENMESMSFQFKGRTSSISNDSCCPRVPTFSILVNVLCFLICSCFQICGCIFCFVVVFSDLIII